MGRALFITPVYVFTVKETFALISKVKATSPVVFVRPLLALCWPDV